MSPSRKSYPPGSISDALERTLARAITWLGGVGTFFLCLIVAILGSGIAIVLLLGIIQYISSPERPDVFGRLVKNVIEGAPGILGYVTIGLMIVLALGVVGALAVLAWKVATSAGNSGQGRQRDYRIDESQPKGIAAGQKDGPAISPPIDAEFKEERDQ